MDNAVTSLPGAGGRTEKGGRIAYLDLLRIITMFSVVVLHTAGQHWNELSPSTGAWQIFNIFDGIVRFAVPVMVMISGVFFLDPKREIPLKKLYGKYILRLAVAYVFWSFVYAIYKYYISGEPFYSGSIKTITIYTINSFYHLWFLPMMIALYMLVPFLQLITRYGGEKLCRYFIILFFVFGILITSLLKFDFPYYDYTRSILTRLPIELVGSYAGYFMLGYYLYTFPISKKLQAAAYILGICSVLGCIAGTSLLSLKENAPVGYILDYFMVTTFFSSIALFIFFKYQVSKLSWSEGSMKRIQYVSLCTFGIYLVHAMILSYLGERGLDTLSFNALLSVPLLAVLIFAASFAVTALLRMIPVVNKYIT